MREEEAILANVRAALEKAPAKTRSRAAVLAELRALQEEARVVAEDDLPNVLHEMSVRQKLLAREEPEAPDPASPYLGHLRVREVSGAIKDYLLGRASFFEPPVRIVDWRVAPIAHVFYRSREGDEIEEELPGRVLEGVVEARRVVVVERGALVRIVCADRVLFRDDAGAWIERRPEALEAGGAGSAARPGVLGVATSVTALLDPEQYAAVSAPADRPLLVLGSAGSGKTTVALHRLARIGAQAPESWSTLRVIVPEEGLARLSRRLLEPLFERSRGAPKVETLDAWTIGLARAVFGDELPRIDREPPALVSSLKRHPALHAALVERWSERPPKTLKRTRRALAELFTDRGFLAGIVAASNGDLPKSAIEETVRHTRLQLAEPTARMLAAITDEELKKTIDGRGVAEATPDELAGTVDVDDVAILLFARALAGGLDAEPIAHVVLDEAEDASLFELAVLADLLGDEPGVTLAGDEAQQTASSFAGWERALETLGARDAAICRLAISYRCPKPIAELAWRVLGPLARGDAPVRTARDGAPVERLSFPEEAQADMVVADAVRDMVVREPKASIAVIAKGPERAGQIHALLSSMPEARLVSNGEFSFEPGVDVTDVDAVKGLEFDYVIVPDAEAYAETDDDRRRLHVAVTRASHQLWLVSSGVR